VAAQRQSRRVPQVHVVLLEEEGLVTMKASVKKRAAACVKREKKHYLEAIFEGMPRAEARAEFLYQARRCYQRVSARGSHRRKSRR